MRVIALVLSAMLALAGSAEGATKRRSVGRHTPEPPYGVYINVTEQSTASDIVRALDLAAADGVTWVRIPFLWSIIQPASGQGADLRLYSAIVTRAAQDHLQLVAVLGYATLWNTTAPASETRPEQREHYPPADYDAWSRFVTFMVTTYKTNVHTWEIWNQPDVGGPPEPGLPCNGFWCGTPEQYASLLTVSYNAIKAADSGANVVFGSLAVAADNRNFLYNVLTTSPLGPPFDTLSWYAFGSKTDILSKFNAIKTQLLYGGPNLRPMWVNFGYPSDPAVQTIAPYSGGEAGQVAYMQDISAYLLSLGMRKLFWFQMVDTNASNVTTDPSTSFGLVTPAFTTKLAYDAYGTLIKSFHP